MRLLVTGSNGFIGKNLVVHLNELKGYSIETFSRENTIGELPDLVERADFIIHLAGENRAEDVSEFRINNAELTQSICDEIRSLSRKIPIIFASSVQAEYANPYGESKRNAEVALEKLAIETKNPVFIYRLPGVFGKWSKPNYNSVVATFCHNIAQDLPIQINDQLEELTLVYIDDLVAEFIDSIQNKNKSNLKLSVQPEYRISLGKLAEQIKNFRNSRSTLILENVGSGLTRALYSTYVSYLLPDKFSYSVPAYNDERGTFSEILKTQKNGQFSFFSAYPGVTRGGHYHHSKTEKFMVVKGTACFRFRNVATNENYEITTNSNNPTIVDTIPGWTHNITNIGNEELIVMLWANEIFDRNNPDTILCEV
jgi:UDP-2-acetamido-2,6-beta-L-arabino-hexul-4-ose reductase